jgi:hypothetical protein
MTLANTVGTYCIAKDQYCSHINIFYIFFNSSTFFFLSLDTVLFELSRDYSDLFFILDFLSFSATFSFFLTKQYTVQYISYLVTFLSQHSTCSQDYCSTVYELTSDLILIFDYLSFQLIFLRFVIWACDRQILKSKK